MGAVLDITEATKRRSNGATEGPPTAPPEPAGFFVPAPLAKAIIDYLAQRPYREAFLLIRGLEGEALPMVAAPECPVIEPPSAQPTKGKP